MGPLTGLRIVENAAFVAVPLAGMTLAQMGACVIRVDRPAGGLDARRWPVTASGASLFWAGLNKGKLSLALDTARPEGVEILQALITAPGPDAGLFLTNLRGRGPLDYPALSALRPDLVMVSLTGTRRGEPAVDYTVNAAIGFPMATGVAGTPPVAHVLPAWDCITGHMVATTLLVAERQRLRHGIGQLAELSLKDVAAAHLAHLGILGEVAVNGVDRARVGNALYGAYGQDFLLADGARVMVIGLTDKQWRGLAKMTGSTDALAALATRSGRDLGAEGDRWHLRDAITAILAPWFATRNLSQVAVACDGAGLTWAPFRSFGQAVADDPDLSPANPMMAMVDHPGIGPMVTPGHPAQWGAQGHLPPAPAPALGQQSAQVLTQVLGLNDAQIGRLVQTGLVAAA